MDGQLAVARAFGDKSLKVHLSATPDIKTVTIDDRTDLLILASDGLWKVDTFSHTEIKFRNTHVTVLGKVCTLEICQGTGYWERLFVLL